MITIRREDCRRAFFRGSGPGGQHRNKTETCVRYVHLPTGIQAEGKSERSRSANDKAAWGLLLAKVAKSASTEAGRLAMAAWAAKPDASFGSQIRSYVLHGPKRRVVDHRTGHMELDPVAVVGRGRIDRLIQSSLESS